jgi:hypothetical protein
MLLASTQDDFVVDISDVLHEAQLIAKVLRQDSP